MAPDLLDRIEMLRLNDATYSEIGRKVGLSEKYISYLCLKHGFEPSKPAWPCWDGVRGPAVMSRGNHMVRRFSAEEDAELLRLEALGLSYFAIGRRLGRTRNSIAGRLMTLARRDARREVA